MPFLTVQIVHKMRSLIILMAVMVVLSPYASARTLTQDLSSLLSMDVSSSTPVDASSPPPPPSPPPPGKRSSPSPSPPPSGGATTASSSQMMATTEVPSPPPNPGKGQGGGQGQGGQAQTTSTTAPSSPPSPEEGQGQGQATADAGTVRPEEADVVDKLPKQITGSNEDTAIDTSAAQSVASDVLSNVDDPKAGASALSSAVSSSTATSVAKGFSSAVASTPSKAPQLSHGFAQLCINVAQSSNVVLLTKCVSSFSISIVFLVVTGEVAVAKTCVQEFTSFIISSGGCSEFVAVILQIFVQITVTLVSPTKTILFG